MDVHLGAEPTRRDLLAGATLAAATLLLPRVVRPPAAEARSASCDSDCLRQARRALARADAACDQKAFDLTYDYDFFFDPVFVRHQFKILCYQANQLAIQAQLAKCRVDCLSGKKTSGQISAAKTTTVAPPKPPPPPSCPEGTFFCTVSPSGGDNCCLNGYTCCSCGICCVPDRKCACCG